MNTSWGERWSQLWMSVIFPLPSSPQQTCCTFSPASSPILTNTNWPQVGFVQPEEHSYAYTLTDTFPVSESTHFFVVVFPESFLKATDSGALMSRRPPCVVPFPTFLHLQDVPQVTEGVRNVSSLKLSMTLCCGYVEPEVEKGHGPSQGEDYHPFFFFWVVLQWMLPLNSFYYKVYSVLLLTQ